MTKIIVASIFIFYDSTWHSMHYYNDIPAAICAPTTICACKRKANIIILLTRTWTAAASGCPYLFRGVAILAIRRPGAELEVTIITSARALLREKRAGKLALLFILAGILFNNSRIRHHHMLIFWVWSFCQISISTLNFQQYNVTRSFLSLKLRGWIALVVN